MKSLLSFRHLQGKTSPPVRSMVQWSPSGFVLFSLINPQKTSGGLYRTTKKTQMRDFSAYQYLSYNLHLSFKPGWFFIYFEQTFKWYQGHEWKSLMLVLGPSSNDRESCGYPKANRGCIASTSNHTAAECVEIFQRPSPNIIQRDPHTIEGSTLWLAMTYHQWGFIAFACNFTFNLQDIYLWHHFGNC